MGTSLIPDPPKAPSIEFVLSQQANDAIAKGANPEAVSQRLGQMVTHLRANPTLAAQASDALARGADIGAIAPRIMQLASSGSGNIDLRDGAQPTNASQKPVTVPEKAPNAAEGIVDNGLDTFTFGLHRKGLGLTQAIGDVLSHGLNAHPIDTYEQSVEHTLAREHAANSQHPTATTAANATGFFGALAAEAPLRALLGLGEAAPAAATAMKRIGQSAKTGAVTGAAIGATSGEGTPQQRVGESVLGGLLGGAFGGGSQAAGEFGGKIADIIHQIAADPRAQGELAASRHIVQRLNADDLSPSDLLKSAQVSGHTGAPTVVAHLGGPSLDPLTWLAAQGPSREAGMLRAAVEQGQNAQGDLLSRGLREGGNLGNESAYRVADKIGRQKALSANRLFGIAESSPPITDPEITKAFIQEPELLKAMQQTVRALGEDATPEELRAVQSIAKVAENPGFAGAFPPQPIPLRLLSETKKEVDATVKSLANKSPNFTDLDARRIQSAMRGILDRADTQAPAYGVARFVFKNDADRLAAMEAGSNLLSKQPERIADELSGLANLDDKSPFTHRLASQNQPDYRLGGVDAIERAMAEKGPSSNLAKQFFSSKADQGRVAALLGPEGAEHFGPFVDQANTLGRVFESTTGNSATAPRQAVRQEVMGSGAADALDVPISAKHAVLRFLNTKDAARRQAVLQALAAKLNIPADSPELPKLVESLYKAIEGPTTDASRMSVGRELFKGATTAVRGPRAQGILAGLFAGHQ